MMAAAGAVIARRTTTSTRELSVLGPPSAPGKAALSCPVTTPMVLPIVALAVTSLSMVIGGAVAYGMMKKSTLMLEKDLRHLSGQMVELIGRISMIEGELKARNQSSR